MWFGQKCEMVAHNIVLWNSLNMSALSLVFFCNTSYWPNNAIWIQVITILCSGKHKNVKWLMNCRITKVIQKMKKDMWLTEHKSDWGFLNRIFILSDGAVILSIVMLFRLKELTSFENETMLNFPVLMCI